jgi:integration host factor subunit beta
MNKSQLITKLADRTGVPRKTVEQAVNIMFESMTEALVRGNRIEVRGFGSFATKLYKPYTGRNPRTGTTIQVPPKRLPFFKAGKETKELVDHRLADSQAAESPSQTES